MCFLFFSCQKEDIIYSCDPEIDGWVKDNLKVISEMNYNDILFYSNNIYLQKSIYTAFCAEQKIEVWKQKIGHVLELTWTDKEEAHLHLLLDIINKYPVFFDSGLHAEFEDEIDLIAYKWTRYAEEELNWKANKIYALIMTINPVSMVNGEIIVDEDIESYPILLKTRSEKTYACNCRKDSECAVNSSCLDVTCDVVNYCGFLGIQGCTGMCGKK